MPQRIIGLERWLREHLHWADYTLAPASADASFRRYFRVVRAGGSYIVMDAPPGKEDCGPFIRIARLMGALGVHVPEVLEADLDQGYLLLTDLGSTPYLPALNAGTVDRLYGDALETLLHLQQGGRENPGLPLYDRALLTREMELFRDWFLQRHLGVLIDGAVESVLGPVFAALADNAVAQPHVFVHRDYHSRNLMVTPERNPGVLDFQDAVYGAVTYDLVSLLRDCYIRWPRAQVEEWVHAYYRALRQADVIPAVGEATFLRWFDLMGVQRHLKAIGIFARLNHRDGKPGYLQDIPRTLAYVEEVAADYPELTGLAQLIKDEVRPRFVA